MRDPQLQPSEDFITTAMLKNAPDVPLRHVRGSHATYDGREGGHILEGPPSTRIDYSDAIAGVPGPTISHETGQFSVFPDFAEISKYTGVMAPHNLARFHQRLSEAGMLEQNKVFQQASGRLSVLLYREDIEACLRTPGFGGFQLLDLQDFPGQGTALVGVLDAFMESKGLITPEQWRQFCAPMVLLARFDRYAWTTTETFEAELQLAHYGRDDLRDAEVRWSVQTVGGDEVASGTLPPQDVAQGNTRSLGHVSVSLDGVTAPAALRLEVAIESADLRTAYDAWVYPAEVDTRPPAPVTLTTSPAEAKAKLADGGQVLLLTSGDRQLARTPGGGFTTDFWNWPMFHYPPGTMGLLIDPSHPALATFPTEFHSNWQWFHIAKESQPVSLAPLPMPPEMIVQTIDNYDRVDRLGLIFELRMGDGRLLVCASPLMELAERDPAARQLLRSLLDYAGSEAFNPVTQVEAEVLDELFLAVVPMRGKATASSVQEGWPRHLPERAADANEGTRWQAARRDHTQTQAGVVGIVEHATGTARAEVTDGAEWWQFVLDDPADVAGIEVLWGGNGGYEWGLEGSFDGESWSILASPRANDFAGVRHRIEFGQLAKGLRGVRVKVLVTPGSEPPAIQEVKLLRPK